MANIKIYRDDQSLAQAAAEHFIQIAEEAVQLRGVFSVALSGGSTPQLLYHRLTSEPFNNSMVWSQAHIFWGDERCVPPDDNASNYGKAKTTLLDPLSIPPAHIYRIPAERKPEQAAEDYEETLLRHFSSLPALEERDQPRFDLVLLGMGEDGHTASLFPGTPGIREENRWVIAQYVDKLASWRISLTPALINLARNVLFLVSGADKRDTLQRVIFGSNQPDRYPAQSIRPENGQILWIVDEAAAALL